MDSSVQLLAATKEIAPCACDELATDDGDEAVIAGDDARRCLPSSGSRLLNGAAVMFLAVLLRRIGIPIVACSLSAEFTYAEALGALAHPMTNDGRC